MNNIAAAADIDDPLVQPLALVVGEADVAFVAELLCGRVRGERFRIAPSSTVPSPTLRLALARTLATGTLGWLVDTGSRARTVLRQGRPLTGRPWDAAVNVDDEGVPFSLRFSAAPVTFLMNLGVHVLPLLSAAATPAAVAQAGTLALRALHARAWPAAATTTGDHVFAALAHDNAHRLGLGPQLEAAMRQALREASPLAALLAPAAAVDDDTVDAALPALLRPDTIRLLELLEDRIAAAWADAPRAILGTGAGNTVIAGAARTVRRATQFVRVLDSARRLDLLGPVVALVAALPAVWTNDLRLRLLRLDGVQTMADRDRVVAALVGLADLASLLEDVRGRLCAERYGDDRFAEAQLVLAVLRDRFVPQRDAIAAATDRLRGVVR
jgi:hypothetical protein